MVAHVRRVVAMADSDTTSRPLNSSEPGQRTVLGDEAQRTIRAHASPEGIVTLLFTDIVESTRFRQRLGDAAAQERLREHNAVVRAQIDQHGGFEVKTQGDGFMVAFSDVAAALACSVEIQKAVAEDNRQHPREQLHMRMGLNSGHVIKEETDFFGGVVIVAARICAMAKGDQILVSEAVRVLAGLPRGIGYIRYGRRRLKGLAESYSIWAVPWSGVESRGLAKLHASAAVRISVILFLVLGVVGGVTGGLMLHRQGSGVAAVSHAMPQQLAISYKAHSVARIVSGDCKTDDLVIRGSIDGEFAGDSNGHLTGSGEITGHASDECQTGYSKFDFTLIDASQNSVSGTLEGPLNRITMLTRPGEGQSRAGYGLSVVNITGGSGLYEGATGSGTCNGLVSGQFQADGSVPGDTEGDCKVQIATSARPVLAADPLVVQLAATPLQVAVSGQAFDPANTVGLAVIYGNTRDTTQRGLRLRLPVPEGSSIVASALAESPAASPGERTWNIPDLAPGELKRFEFRLRVVAAQGTAIPLVVDIDGDGFASPVASNTVTIDVTR